MDKVKQYLELVRKHHFWILCALAALVGLVAWQLSTGKLEAEFQANAQKIKSALQSVGGVSSDTPHDDWKPGIDKETDRVRQDVKSAWDKLYQQQQEKVFIWPKELGQAFITAIEKTQGTNQELEDRFLRDRYQNMVKRFVAGLAGIVDAAPFDQPTNPGPAVGGDGNVALIVPKYHVVWTQQSFQDILATFDWTERPSTLLVKYAQEELWVYEALCKVIQEVNKGSAGAHDAPIKQIDELFIAYNAVEDVFGGGGQQRRIDAIVASAAAPGLTPESPVGATPGATDRPTKPDPKARGKGGDAAIGGGLFSGRAGPGGETAPAAPANPDDLLKSFRYVNDKGAPLMATEVDAAAGEFNLMPFKLLLKMETGDVDRLLIACRNSVLPIEVQQVRINPQTASGGGGGFGGGFGGGIRPMGERESGYGGGGFTPAAGVPQLTDRTATVEVRGVVYLIKRPDFSKLNLAPAGTPGAPDAPTTPADPAAPTALVPTPPANVN